ncbi:MAG: nitroreductase family protein [Burkholderiales bacterium]
MPTGPIVADVLRRIENADETAGDAARAAALALLLSRFSVSPKYLGEPGPSDDEILTMALAALRAPDHDKLVPFRFVVARGEGLARLAQLFVDYGMRRGKSGDELEQERVRALQAPVVVAVVARIDEHNDVPVHEQWACVGGAVSNFMTACHLLGYAGKVLSGVRASDATIQRAYCAPGEQLLGWISLGTGTGPARRRGEKDPGSVVSTF